MARGKERWEDGNIGGVAEVREWQLQYLVAV